MSNALPHLRELAARKSRVYELLLALESNSKADVACFQSLAGIVDRVLFNEVSVDASALRDLTGLVSSPAEDLASTLAVLDVALSEAEPDRAGLSLLLAGFPGWIKAASDDARSHVLSILPNIAAHLKELKDSGVDSLIACFNACSSAGDRDAMARSIVRYQEISGDIILASAEIASVLLRTGAAATIERLLIAVPPEEMIESKDARLLLPAIAGLRKLKGGDEAWGAAAAVCLAAAKHNHSSALNLAREFAGILAPLEQDARVAYLKAFESIIEHAGISLIGYSSKQLPAMFRKTGADRATAFVAEGVAISRRYGKVAAQEFFEQKTPAAQQAAHSA